MDLTNCLFQWLKTFDLEDGCTTVEDLSDGVAIAQALVQIVPEHFTPLLSKKIEDDCGTNWFLKLHNLRRIYLSISEYYREVLDRNVSDKLMPDLEAIARNNDLPNLGKLLKLILGCAINCESKEKHIEVMTTLSLEVKQAIKIAIDEIENFEDNSTVEESSYSQLTSNDEHSPNDRTKTMEEFHKIQEELSMTNVLKENAVRKCSELESKIIELEEEKRNLKLENDKLIDKFSKNVGSKDHGHMFDSIENEALFLRLTSQVNAYKMECTRIEEQKEDYKMNLELKEKEYQKLLLQVDQLQTKLNEFKHDRDELDRLKYLSEEIIKYKNINEVQKKKLEEFQELKKQTKVIEDRNESLIKQICELEEDKKSIAVYKSQLDLIKKQRDELRAKINEETFRADKTEDELNRVYQKYNDSVQEKEKLQLELETLKSEMVHVQKNDLLMMAPSIDMDLSQTNASSQMLGGGGVGLNFYNNNNTNNNKNNSMVKMDSDSNEKLIRLEYENNKLKKELKQSTDEKVKFLESQIDDEKLRVAKMEQTNRLNCQRIIELEGQIKDLKSTNNANAAIVGGGGGVNENLRSKLIELQTDNNNLKALLEKKNEELADKEERFKKHLLKAKETYGILETHMNNAKISSSSLPDTSKVQSSQSDDAGYWRNLCNQKDMEMERLKSEFDQAIAFRDIEERLMSVSFHKMSLNLQRKAAEDRMYSSNQFPSNTTFLSRQRQASSRKFIIPSRNSWSNNNRNN